MSKRYQIKSITYIFEKQVSLTLGSILTFFGSDFTINLAFFEEGFDLKIKGANLNDAVITFPQTTHAIKQVAILIVIYLFKTLILQNLYHFQDKSSMSIASHHRMHSTFGSLIGTKEAFSECNIREFIRRQSLEKS